MPRFLVRRLGLLSVLLVVPRLSAQGAPPSLLHLQARVADSAGVALNGPVTVEVRVYDVPFGGVALWNETHAATALNGVVSLLLGSISAPPGNLFDGTSRYLAIRVGADAEMTPRREIAAVPFARRAAAAAALEANAAVPNGLITSAHVADGTIAAADLANGAVTSLKIAAGAVGASAIAAGAVDATKIANNAISGAHIVNGSLTSADLGNGAVMTAQIAPSAVTSNEILDGAVGTAKIANLAVTNAKLAASSVDASKIVDGSVGAAELADPITGNGLGTPVVEVDATGAGGVAIHGHATHSAVLGFGVKGESASTTGSGMLGIATSATGSSSGVYGTSSSSAGFGVYGIATSASGSAVGVYGETNVVGNAAGVSGVATATGNVADGVRGASASEDGYGVWGRATNATNNPAVQPVGVAGNASARFGYGVEGTAPQFGVHGHATDLVLAGWGVTGDTASTVAGSAGVHGIAGGATGAVYGVRGTSLSSSGRGVVGLASTVAGTQYGVYGVTNSPAGFGVYSLGDFGGNGAKYFVQPHPTDASKEIRFVCLEGNESGTYFRGTAKLEGGRAVIDVPEEFRLASEPANLTAMVVAQGAPATLWVESKDLDRIVVRGDRDVELDYFVNGVRRGFAGHRAIRENQGWVPELRGVPFGTQYPEALRRILVENGTLNPDFTPNEATAAQRGWALREPADETLRTTPRAER